MAQLSSYIQAPYQGVSQAPPQARQPDQAEVLEDCLISIPQGWTSRPPLSWWGKLHDHPGHTNGIFERIEREGDADALVTLTWEAGAIVPRVYLIADFPGDVTPEPVTVTTAAQAYLNYGTPDNPVDDLFALTVEDYTFIGNRKRPVAKSSALAATRPYEAIVWLKQAAYGRTFKVTVTPATGTPVEAMCHTPDGTAASDGPYVDTTLILDVLKQGTAYTTANGGSHSGRLDDLTTQGFTVIQYGPVCYISHPTINFTVTVEDGLGGSAFVAIKESVQTVADLPKLAATGFTVRITQSTGSTNDDYYMRFENTAGGNTGIWQETLAPGAELGLDPATMPLGLVYDGGWKLDVLGWGQRVVGDQFLSPDPDFVGQPIQDLCFWRGRLGIIAGEGVTLSSAVDPLKTYPTTLSSVLDSDTLGLLSPFPSRSPFRYAINFDTRLVIFGDISQAVVQASDVVKPSTTRIDILTTYAFSQTAGPFKQPPRPQSSNGKVYFLAPQGTRYSVGYEMKVDNVVNVTGADPTTVQVPRYLPFGVDRIGNCPVGYLLSYGRSGDTQLTLHNFRYVNDERVQNGWLKWNLPVGYLLAGCLFQNTQLFVLASSASEAHLLVADTAPDTLDEGSTRLLTSRDLRVTEQDAVVAYSALTGVTTITVPWPINVAPTVTVRAPGGPGGLPLGGTQAELPEGYFLSVSSYDPATRTVTLVGDYSETPLYIGVPYTARWELSKIYAQAKPNEPIHSGRMSLRRIAADLAGTGYLRAEVTAKGRPVRHYIFTGYRLDDPDSLYDISPSAEGVFRFPVHTENTQARIVLLNDSHFQCRVQGFEWIAELNQKAQRIG